jgi:hypothetical protein
VEGDLVKRGDLVRATIFMDLNPIHPKISGDYDPRDVFKDDLGVILEVDTKDPVWLEGISYKQPGMAWVKWCVNGMVGWSDAFRLEVV